MKVSCTRENLQTGLSTVSRIASRNLTLPILGNVLLRAQDGTLSLMATNLEIGVVSRVRCKVVENGSVTIQARLLADFVSLLENEKVDLTTDGASLHVAGERSETTIRGVSADDFPIIPSVEHHNGLRADADVLRAAIGQVLFAAAQDTSRPEISGVYCSVNQESMTLAATDSYRLAERSVPLLKGAGKRAVIVPSRAFAELFRSLPTEGEIEIYFSETQALFVSSGTELTTRLIEGQYPDYQQIVPSSSATEATVDVEPFVKLVRTASLFCKPGINDVTVSFDPAHHQVTCSAANSELGAHRGSIEAAVEGKALDMVLNYRYLLDGLANIGSDSVKIGASDNANPGVLRPVTKGATYLYLIMPIRQ